MDKATAKPGRKKKVFHTEVEKMKIFLEYRKLFQKNGEAPYDKKVSDTDLWLKAQSIAIPDKSRHVHWSSFTIRRKEYAQLLASGDLDVEVSTHDHRPLEERGFVRKVDPHITQTPQPPQPPQPLSTGASLPFSIPAFNHVGNGVTSAEQPQVPTPGSLDQAITVLVQHVVRTELLPQIHGLIKDLMFQVDLRLNDQYLRLLEYWDPQLAMKAREEQKTGSAANSVTSSLNGLGTEVLHPQTSPPAPPAPPAPPKLRVLVCGGKEDGFWSYLQDSLPANVIVEFADGHKPKSIPTSGKKYDAVIVHWMTSHPARAVIKNYYPDHEFMDKGSTTKLVGIIKSKLGIS